MSPDSHESTTSENDSVVRISRIQTQWTLLRQAHQSESAEEAQVARAAVVARYIAPMYKYLTRVLPSHADAEDVAHDVVLRLMQGKLAAARPEGGRFRDYLKTVLINSARTWFRQDTRISTDESAPEVAVELEWDELFEDCVREDVMAAAWNSMEEYERKTNQPFASLLRWRTTVDKTSTAQLVEVLRKATGQVHTGSNARKLLQRARELYANLLLEEVRRLLPKDQRDNESVEEELIVLGLHKVCRPAHSRNNSES